jgi:hypothetical protein
MPPNEEQRYKDLLDLASKCRDREEWEKVIKLAILIVEPYKPATAEGLRHKLSQPWHGRLPK